MGKSNTMTTLLVKDCILVNIIDLSDLYLEAKKIHKTNEYSSIALGQTIVCGALLSSDIKNENEKITVKVNGTNQIKNIVSIVDSNKNIKADISDPDSVTISKFSVKETVGKGSIHITRDIGTKRPYTGKVLMTFGDIDLDINHYLEVSNQQISFIKTYIGICDKKDSAYGIYVRLLPDYSEEEHIKFDFVKKLLSDYDRIKTITDEVGGPLDKKSEYDFVRKVFQLPFKILKKDIFKYKCDCSDERMKSILKLLSYDELKEVSIKNNIEIKCNYCKKKYKYNINEFNK